MSGSDNTEGAFWENPLPADEPHPDATLPGSGSTEPPDEPILDVDNDSRYIPDGLATGTPHPTETDTIFVPRLLGLPLDEAQQHVIDFGLTPKLDPFDRAELIASGINLATRPEGVVLAQNPTSAVALPTGGIVTLRYLDPAQPRTSPAGKPVKSRGNFIIGGILAVIAVIMVTATIAGSGTANEPTPATSTTPTAPASPGQTSLTVNVPNLVGLDPDKAETTLANSGLALGQTVEQSVTEQVGDIVGQYPAAGFPTDKGTTVNLVVGAAGNGQPVPGVVDKPEQDAANAIKAAGFTLVPSQTVDSDSPPGTVVQQLPAAGQLAPAGGEVLLLLSNGKKRMLNVVGSTEEQAASDLVALGLKVKVYSLNDTRKPAGTVIGQSPREGGYVTPGGEVSITIASGGPSGTPTPTNTNATSTPAPTTTPTPEPSGPSASVIPNPGVD